MAKHGHQSIDAEAVNFPPDKVADPWLGDLEQARRLSLGETPTVNDLAKPDHEIGPNLEILSFLVGKPKVAEYVTR